MNPLNSALGIIVVVGIINTVICLATKGFGVAILSAVGTFVSYICFGMLYGACAAGGFPAFLVVFVMYFGGNLVYAIFTVPKPLIQYYMLYVMVLCMFLADASITAK